VRGISTYRTSLPMSLARVSKPETQESGLFAMTVAVMLAAFYHTDETRGTTSFASSYSLSRDA